MDQLEYRKKYFNTEKKWACLLGSAPSSLRLAPFGNPEWYMIGCSPGVYGIAPRVDCWFELHRYEPGQPWFSPEYCQYMAKFAGPVYMAEVRGEIPHSAEVPIADLIVKYGPYFFTSSLAYMLAMAIEAGFEKIMLAGVDMAAESEYGFQRAGCQFFAMIAKAHGIEVGVPPESDLFRPSPLYGISEISHGRIKIMARRRELEGRIAAALQTQQNAKDETLFLRGALDDLTWAEQTWHGNVDGMGSRFTEPPSVPALRQFNLNMNVSDADLDKLRGVEAEPVETSATEAKPLTEAELAEFDAKSYALNRLAAAASGELRPSPPKPADDPKPDLT